MRSLDAEEERLWARVAATIRPLSRDPVPPRDGEGDHRARPGGGGGVVQVSGPPPPPSAVPLPVSGRIAGAGKTLDSTWDRRLRSGSISPDRVIDLHGLNLDRAWNAIDLGLDRAIAAGERVVLLITGHSRDGVPPVRRGRIRAAVHDWLTASRHAPAIAAVRGAHPRHGGGGSLYIILRRSGRNSTLS